MILRLFKIIFISISFIFLTGFVQLASLVGPSVTIFSTGNVYKASAQFMVDKHIKNKTGKSSLAYVKEEVTRQNDQKDFNKELIKLVEKRIKNTHKKIVELNNQKNFNKELIALVENRIKISRKQLNFEKIN